MRGQVDDSDDPESGPSGPGPELGFKVGQERQAEANLCDSDGDEGFCDLFYCEDAPPPHSEPPYGRAGAGGGVAGFGEGSAGEGGVGAARACMGDQAGWVDDIGDQPQGVVAGTPMAADGHRLVQGSAYGAQCVGAFGMAGQGWDERRLAMGDTVGMAGQGWGERKVAVGDSVNRRATVDAGDTASMGGSGWADRRGAMAAADARLDAASDGLGRNDSLDRILGSDSSMRLLRHDTLDRLFGSDSSKRLLRTDSLELLTAQYSQRANSRKLSYIKGRRYGGLQPLTPLSV